MPLIDMLKEAILRTGCLKSITSVAGSRTLPEEVLAERLMLAIHAHGTNTRGLGAFHRGRLRVVGR
ncbi:hypothetical protein ACFWIQ_26345 [Kitasatospora sp. NPDC127059]|uniref:hypothetical protein n=1 Tax=unclassified Kitasatospora TaxID=2633591 RepID=UPI00365FA7A2